MESQSFAVVGLGVISKFYLAALERSPAAGLVAVCDRNPAALAPWQGRVPCYTDHRELLAHERLDGVIVTVPNDAHTAVCGDALRAGVPVCVEKPLALTSAEAAGLTAAAEAARVPLFTAFHRRYNARVRQLARQLEPCRDEIASVVVRYFEQIEEHTGNDSWYLDPARCGGGCVADNGPNAFDLVRLLLGDSAEPSSPGAPARLAVSSATVGYDAIGVDRRAVVELSTASGGARERSSARVELDWSYPGEVKDITVTLTDGTVRHADMLAGHHGFKASLWHEYEAILAEFLARLRSPFRVDDGGPAALRLVEAAYRASDRVSDRALDGAPDRAPALAGWTGEAVGAR
ncbi:Gfo/Idh/MocA family protein [Streptacidiphilus sp. MAP5-3]|uniref:Gfo/Idh/MocA family protein n=1 Tax=unclassified Streptacidiphilus TaxID=2643834 RepID=UPI0035173460